MVLPNGTSRWTGVTGCLTVCLLLWAAVGRAEDFRLESVGARGGISANLTGVSFNQAELFANWNLPWAWDLGKEWLLASRLDLSAGWLADHDDNAFIGTLGPTLVLNRERLPVSFEGGVSPTLLSQYAFGSRNFGMYIQFTSHVGLNWDFTAHWRLGYRLQHMSNAGLGEHNRGLNMHLFALSYVF
jgi:lipid A 3-O-deacylase